MNNKERLRKLLEDEWAECERLFCHPMTRGTWDGSRDTYINSVLTDDTADEKGKPIGRKNSADSKRKFALELKKSGYSIREIQTYFGYKSRSSVYSLLP